MDLHFSSDDFDDMRIKIITTHSFGILAEASELTGNKIEPTPAPGNESEMKSLNV